MPNRRLLNRRVRIGCRSAMPILLLLCLMVAASGISVGQPAADATGGDGSASAPPVETGLGDPGQYLEGPIDPEEYLLGPGDLLNVRIVLRPPIDRTVRLSPEGLLILPEGASVELANVSLADAEGMVKEVLSRYYRNPEVKLQLLELRTFGVFIVGEVWRPGLVMATAIDRATELIRRAGGMKPDASRRAIQLKRANGEVLPVDLGLFEATGSLTNNPVVAAGDQIYVPPKMSTAVVSGAVNKPGEIEVIDGDMAETALALAHGLREDALEDSAYIESFDGSPRHSKRRMLNLRRDEDKRAPIRERDLLFVRPRPTWRETRSVLIEGEVRYPGTHAITADSLPLTQVITQAGGFTEFASLGEAYVMRRQEDLPPDPDFERLSKLPTSEMTPDEYDYYALRLRTRRPLVSADFLSLFLRGDKSHNIHIYPGDEIHIPRLHPFVTVVGEISRPGSIPFETGMTVDQYIERAGGYTWRAKKGQVSVIRALTGEWAKKGKVKQVGPGDTIFIPRKPRRNYWKITLDTLTVLTQLATLYLVVDTASN